MRILFDVWSKDEPMPSSGSKSIGMKEGHCDDDQGLRPEIKAAICIILVASNSVMYCLRIGSPFQYYVNQIEVFNTIALISEPLSYDNVTR